MREALRTLAQCHSHRILHRDVKPGNFMLLSDADNAPLKAIGGSPCARASTGVLKMAVGSVCHFAPMLRSTAALAACCTRTSRGLQVPFPPENGGKISCRAA